MHYYELQPIKFFLFDECFAMRSDKFLVLCIYNEKAYALGAIVIQFAPCYDRQMDIGWTFKKSREVVLLLKIFIHEYWT